MTKFCFREAFLILLYSGFVFDCYLSHVQPDNMEEHLKSKGAAETGNAEFQVENDPDSYGIATSYRKNKRSSRSTGNCDSTAACYTFKATVFSLIGTQSAGSVRMVTLVPKRTYFNYEPVEFKEKFKVDTAVTEKAVFQFSEVLSQFCSINFEHDALTTFDSFTSSAVKKLKAGLSTAFQADSISGKARKYGVASKIPFRFERKVIVAPCEKFEITTVADVATNSETDYRVQLKITGEDTKSNRKLTSQEIIQTLRSRESGLVVLEGNSNGDSFTVVAETTAKLLQTYVSKNMTNGQGTPIPDCVAALRPIYKAKVFSLVKTSRNEGTSRIAPATYTYAFINNCMEQNNFNASFTIEVFDTAEFEYSEGLRLMSSISFGNGVYQNLSNSFPQPSPSVTYKLTQALPTAFEKESSSNEIKNYIVKDTKKESWQATGGVRPCTRNERGCDFKFAENIETNFRILVEITAKSRNTGIQLRAKEIRKGLEKEEQLKFLVAHSNAETFRAVAETSAQLVENLIESVNSKEAHISLAHCL